MHRPLVRFAALASLCASLALPAAPVSAQSPAWNDARSVELVQRATARRAEQLADTGLVDYTANAHGYLTFLAQLGEGFTEPPQVVKADELELEVFWKAPNLSRQRIVGRRDTLLLPTDINYHRDHLGIVQNNFPDIIRLGEGDEVADVPHPLSAPGMAAYDYRIADSLSIRLPDRTIEVYRVDVRPKDDQRPAVVGAVFIDRAEGQVVRMAFNFTRAAYLDRDLEDLAIVLENALVGTRFWLPRRQEIEIRRIGRWLDFPARGIIRGRWEIRRYELNVGLSAAIFRGPEIVQAPRSVLEAKEWQGRILDSLPPDVRALTDEDVRRVQEEARALVRADALQRARATSIAGRGVSEFVRVNRAEGLSFGAGLSRRLGGGFAISGSGRFGLEDEEAKGRLSLRWERASGVGVRLAGWREYRDARDEPERSGLINSIAAQEFGSDYTEPFDERALALSLSAGTRLGMRWTLDGAYAAQKPVMVVASPASGRYEPTLPALELREGRLTLTATRPTALSIWGSELRARLTLRAARFDPHGSFPADEYYRMFALANLERPFGSRRAVMRATFGTSAYDSFVPAQALHFAGGPVSAPGYDFLDFAGTTVGTVRAEWRSPMSFVSFRLGRYGRTPATATLAPFAHAVYVSGPAALGPERRTEERRGWYPAVGLGTQVLFDLLRFDVARGLRDGRWSFSVDVGRDFWSVL
jgi:hypothetical protein